MSGLILLDRGVSSLPPVWSSSSNHTRSAFIGLHLNSAPKTRRPSRPHIAIEALLDLAKLMDDAPLDFSLRKGGMEGY
jgi:hypothetical protein